jgi:hypothetical protein
MPADADDSPLPFSLPSIRKRRSQPPSMPVRSVPTAEGGLLLLDFLVYRKQAIDDEPQDVLIEQSTHVVADLVLQIPADADQTRPGNEQRSNCLAVTNRP